MNIGMVFSQDTASFTVFEPVGHHLPIDVSITDVLGVTHSYRFLFTRKEMIELHDYMDEQIEEMPSDNV